MQFKLSEIALKIGATLDLKGKEDCVVQGFSPLENAKPDRLSFLANPQYRAYLASTQAGAVILSPENAQDCAIPVLTLKDPYVGFAKAAALFDDSPKSLPGIHLTAILHDTVKIAACASVGAYVVLEEGVEIGENVSIGAGCIIGAFTRIGAGTILKPRVVTYHRVQIGKNCLIHSGAVIGSDGFGLANENGRWLKVPQLGSVEIHDEVEIGSNTTIDRGAIENTVIGEGVKIDNQVQIAHNVRIGKGTAMAAQVGIAGSTSIGQYCLLGGKVGVNGHLEIGDNIIVAAMSGISKNTLEPGIYSASLPARPVKEWNKFLARLNFIEKIMRKKNASGSD